MSRAVSRAVKQTSLSAIGLACTLSCATYDAPGSIGKNQDSRDDYETASPVTDISDAAAPPARGASPGSAQISPSPAPPESCGCRPARKEVDRFCIEEMAPENLATFTQREQCGSFELRFDYHHGVRVHHYDDQGALVHLHADNAFAGGLASCGVIPSCTGEVDRKCRLCRGSLYVDDDVPDCPETLWSELGAVEGAEGCP